jgi:hypothetical protein
MENVIPQTLDEALPQLRTGDVLLAVGAENDLIASGIRAVTHSEYTHAAMLRLDYGHPIVYEAVAEGTSDRHLKEWVKREYQYVSVFRSDEIDVAKAIEFLIAHKGFKYDFGQDWRIWWQTMFPALFKVTTRWGEMAPAGWENINPESFICSEYVSCALVAGGVDPCAKSNAYTTPGDLAKSPALSHILYFKI